MPTPIKALTDLTRRILYCNKGIPKLDITEQVEYKVACAVVDYNGWVGLSITTTGDVPKDGFVAEVIAEDKFLCIFGTEKVELGKSQFEFAPKGPQDPERREPAPAPIPMILNCPACGERHIDSNGWEKKIHTTHACQNCGLVWRPALVATVGVQFLPGYKNDGLA